MNYVADLIGTATLADSLNCATVFGTVCIAGFLGGLKPIDNFIPLLQIPSTVKLKSFGSAFVFGSKEFPFNEIPIQCIVSDIEQKKIPYIHSRTFGFRQIIKAHQLMKNNSAYGKIVIEV